MDAMVTSTFNANKLQQQQQQIGLHFIGRWFGRQCEIFVLSQAHPIA